MFESYAYLLHTEDWNFVFICCIQKIGILCLSAVYRRLKFCVYLLHTEHWHFVFISDM
jgi:hypothetical protein